MIHPEPTSRLQRAFTLVELLVVLGIIAVLMGLLLPTLSKARQQAMKVQCMSNLRQIHQELTMYANASHGWLFPMRDSPPWAYGYAPVAPDGSPEGVGPGPFECRPEYIWTTMVFGKCDPPIMVCPTDAGDFPETELEGYPVKPVFWHSYVLNQHLADYKVKASAQGKQIGWKSQSEVILMGEKFPYRVDYFMEQSKNPDGTLDPNGTNDFSVVIDQFKHGMQLGSNYLYLDGHVDNDTRDNALRSLDPWNFMTTP